MTPSCSVFMPRISVMRVSPGWAFWMYKGPVEPLTLVQSRLSREFFSVWIWPPRASWVWRRTSSWGWMCSAGLW